MSTRQPRRDPSSVAVTIRPENPETGTFGNGSPEDGGGPLQGGLHLKNRFVAEIQDPAVPYSVVLTLRARDGRLAVEGMTLREVSAESPPVTGVGLRSMTLDTYVSRVREVLGEDGEDALVTREPGRPKKAQLGKTALGKVTTQVVADFYRDALSSPDPQVNRRPTQAVADRLGLSRGYVSRLLTQARQEGLLGTAQRGQAGEM